MSLVNSIPKVVPGEKYPANNDGAHLKPRESSYDPDFHDEAVFGLCMLGRTIDEICESFGIKKSTFHRWIKANSSFWDAVKRGRDIATAQVTTSLFKKATGFTKKIQKPMVIGIGDGCSKVEIVEYDHFHAPDTAAIKFFLSNMERDKFAERKEVTVAKTIVVEMDLGDGRPPKEIVSNAKELAPPSEQETAYTPFEDLPDDEEDTGDDMPAPGWVDQDDQEEDPEEDIDLLDL